MDWNDTWMYNLMFSLGKILKLGKMWLGVCFSNDGDDFWQVKIIRERIKVEQKVQGFRKILYIQIVILLIIFEDNKEMA